MSKSYQLKGFCPLKTLNNNKTFLKNMWSFPIDGKRSCRIGIYLELWSFTPVLSMAYLFWKKEALCGIEVFINLLGDTCIWMTCLSFMGCSS